MSFTDKIKEWLLHSPPARPGAEGLRGFWIPQVDGDYFICSTCYGRLSGRGISLPHGIAVCDDVDEPYGVCIGCDK